MERKTIEREYLFDNIKGMMLFLVAFGHLLDVYASREMYNVEYSLMKYIYLFHMPMFSFVTGYFTKNLEKARDSAVKKTLIPYLCFQGVYVLTAAIMIAVGAVSYNADVFNYSILLPSSAFYYLLAVFFWKLFAKDIMRLRYPVFISVILGLLISLTRFSEFHCGYGAIFSLLVFFVLGMKCDKNAIVRIRELPHSIAVFILLLGIIPAVYFPYAIHSIRLNYVDEGFSNVEGMAWRLVYYMIAVVMGIAIINLTPGKRTFLSQIGKYSLLVYAGSTFLSPSGYILIEKLFNTSRFRMLNFGGMVLFCILIMFIMSQERIAKIYQIIESGIIKLLFKRSE